MYVYEGPRGYASLKHFVKKGYKMHPKDIIAVPPELTYFQIRLKQLSHFVRHHMQHFEGAFQKLKIFGT